jgi:L-lactate dehydrogenase complex protein LldG
VTARDDGRALVLGSIRRSLGVNGREAPRRKAVADRLASHPSDVIPARGHLPARERLDLFATMVEGVAGTVDRVADAAAVPAMIAAFLRRHNLELKVQRGRDPYLAALPWEAEPALVVDTGAPDPTSAAAVAHAFAGIAETGTLALASGPDNPTSLNFLPDYHIVVVRAEDVVGDIETMWQMLRRTYGATLPRNVNLITGPSRTGDIEQTLVLGAHGPRRLHVIVVGTAD